MAETQNKFELMKSKAKYERIKAWYERTPKDKVWAFMAGQYSNDFRGNPKYLFLYINEYRKDIKAYWLCSSDEVIQSVQNLGYEAYKIGTLEAEIAMDFTGVLVAEQVKAVIPGGLENAKYLNLWHGVGGVKAVERSLITGGLTEEIAKKYIEKNAYYRTHELYLAPSAFIEGIAREQLGLDEKQIIRAGYPRNIYQKKYQRVRTFDHDLIGRAGLPEDTRIVAYTPTYRMSGEPFFASAIPDMQALISVCEEQHLLFIFKMHPLSEKEMGFQKAKESFSDCKWLYFWDNKDDFYEIMDQIDLCIMDFSSIFTDFIAVGVRHFLRYAFDFTNEDLDFPIDYDEATPGRKCLNFEELLLALGTYDSDDIWDDLDRIRKLYWEFDDENSLDRIIDKTVAFAPEQTKYRSLYSFDVFDTLISRKVLAPEGIFYSVRERMKESSEAWPAYLLENYPFIRINAERNVREYYNRSIVERNDEKCEIQFHEIFDRIQTVYGISEQQAKLLAEWEMEAELDNVVPVLNWVEHLKKLKTAGEEVILISDMYLPENFVRKMLAKADPVLEEIPLYLSSTWGSQKSRKSLFLEVYRHYGTEYPFEKWVHYGDNPSSDVKLPRTLNIAANAVEKPEFNLFEQKLVEKAQSYDGYLVAGMLARFRTHHKSMRAYFAYAYISMLFVPYIRWALLSSVQEGKETAYFISRDGHQLKRIADVILEKEQLNLKTKYIYASRRTWRIPSFFDHIDIGFWGQGYGNLARISSYTSLLNALDISDECFCEIFPELIYLRENEKITPDENLRLGDIIKSSKKYEEYLLKKASEERVPSCGYLRQEMDMDSPFSVIEYWGRGYTQENFTRLWQYITGRNTATTFYYSRSTLPSDEYNIRRNYTTHSSSQAFIESIFSCIDYKTIEGYFREEGEWKPVITANECDEELFHAMEKFLPEFVRDFYELPIKNRDSIGRTLIDFAITWQEEHREWEYFTEILARQVDSVEMYGAQKEYAPRLTDKLLDRIVKGERRNQVSKCIEMSYHRAMEPVQKRFLNMFQIEQGEDLTSNLKLSETEIKQNATARENYAKQLQQNDERQELYELVCKETEVQNKVICMTEGKSFDQLEYESMTKQLSMQEVLEVKLIALGAGKNNQTQLIKEIASAQFIIITHPIAILSDLTLRQDTSLIVLNDTAVHYFKNYLAANRKLRWEDKLAKLRLKNYIKYVVCASENTYAREVEKYGLGEEAKPLLVGNLFTDCYFDEEAVLKAKEKMYEVFPGAYNKKVISYLPYQRERNAKSRYASMLNLRELRDRLSDEYVIALNLMGNAKGLKNEIDILGFSVDFTGYLSVRELMMAADIIVADYRDTTFEAAAIGKPVYVTGYDHLKFDLQNVFCGFDEMTFGMSVKDSSELADYLTGVRIYDDSNRKKFVEKYLKYCDGHSAERLVRFMTDNTLRPRNIALNSPRCRFMVDILQDREVLLWDSCLGAFTYEVAVKNEDVGTYRKVADVSEDRRYFYLPKDTEEIYSVRAKNEESNSYSEWTDAGVFSEEEIPCIGDQDTEIEPSIIGCAKNAGGGIRLYWKGNEKTLLWKIYRKSDEIMELIKELPNLCTWEWADENGDVHNNQRYAVSAVCMTEEGELVESEPSQMYSPKTVTESQLLSAKHVPEGIRLSWSAMEGTSAYRVYKKIGDRAQYQLVKELTDEKTTEILDKNVPCGIVRYILQFEQDEILWNSTPLKLEVEEPLKKPENLQVTVTEEGKAMLLWDSMEDINSWNIRRCSIENPNGSKVAEVDGKVCWWEDNQAPEDTTGYRIEAMKAKKNFRMMSGYCKEVKMQA